VANSGLAAAPLIISASSLLASVIAVTISRRNSRIAEVNLLGGLRNNWQALGESWQRMQVALYGPYDYYTRAHVNICEEFTVLNSSLASGSLPHDEGRAHARPWINAARDLVDFWGSVSTYVLRGQLSPQSAYAILGPEFVRASKMVRTLLGNATYRQTGSEELACFSDFGGDKTDWIADWINADQYEGQVERVLCMQDLLWAQAAKQQDLYDHELELAAYTKRQYGTGVRSRKRVRLLCRRLGGSPALAIKLQWQLTASELVRTNSDLLDIPIPKRLDKGIWMPRWKQLTLLVAGWRTI
jgi:hypothetical protein